MNLIRNSPHNNGIYTILNQEASLVIKSSYTQNGISSLIKEENGYNWYLDKYENNPIQISKIQTSNFMKIYLPFVTGTSGNHNLSLSRNINFINKVIDHYVLIWPSTKDITLPIHGDFSVGNIMLLENGNIFIIDWEHFTQSGGPWGFDLVNMLYESVYFSMTGNKMLEVDEAEFRTLRHKLNSLIAEFNGFSCNIFNLKNFIMGNKNIWNEIIHKLPCLKFTNEQIQYLTRLEKKLI